jgi:hypothetical protein
MPRNRPSRKNPFHNCIFFEYNLLKRPTAKISVDQLAKRQAASPKTTEELDGDKRDTLENTGLQDRELS